ncbi:hypothetical protein UlMin_001709 [Ulmus minor]
MAKIFCECSSFLENCTRKTKLFFICIDFCCVNLIHIPTLLIPLISQLKALWQAFIISIFWAVWSKRNQATFEGKKPKMDEARSLSGIMHNSIHDLMILRWLHVSGRPSKTPWILEVTWCPPPPGRIKVNTDGATHDSPGLASCSGVLRTCRGFIKGCFAIPIGVCFAFEAEIAAAILPWCWRATWDKCLTQLSQMEFVVSHIYHEGNYAVDYLASRGTSITTATWWWSTPSFCSQFISIDSSSRPSFRFCCAHVPFFFPSNACKFFILVNNMVTA